MPQNTESETIPVDRLVAEIAVDRLAECVAPQQRRAGPAERRLAHAEFGLNTGNRKAEGLPSGIEEQVTKHRRQQHSPLRAPKRLCQFRVRNAQARQIS
jgi:hypothetical protein